MCSLYNMCISQHLVCSTLCTLCLLPFMFMYMFVPLYIFVNIVFVPMDRMPFGIKLLLSNIDISRILSLVILLLEYLIERACHLCMNYTY